MKYNFDIEIIKKQLESVIRHSQNYRNYEMNVEPLIAKWLENKKYFIEKLDGNLIYEIPQPVSFELDEESKSNRLETFAEIVATHYDNYQLSHFLYNIKPDDFYNNKTSRDYYETKDITIPANFKVVKAFKFFIDDPEILHKLQSEASAIIQENVIKGRLCFSVHPLDFLSASENAHNWRSCHALDGDYRSGNLNYLMDSSTVICYLRADKEAKLPHFPESIPWNSKKWRVWLFFSNDRSMLFAGRQYPFTANFGLELIKENILKPLNFGSYGPFYSKKLTSFDITEDQTFFCDRMVPVGSTMCSLTDLIINGKNTYHYNDLLKSSCYTPLYAYRLENWRYCYNNITGGTNQNQTIFHIGEACPCPLCGRKNIDFGEIMACFECDDRYSLNNNQYEYEFCDICGSSVYYEEIVMLEFSEQRVCPNCYASKNLYQCQVCGTKDVPELVKYIPEDGRCLCPACKKDIVQLIENIEIEF